MGEYEELEEDFELLADKIKGTLLPRKKKYYGNHDGIVAGKWFERTRRARKSHAQRRAEIVARSIKSKY